MSTTRMRGLHDAAVRLFLRQGYAQTQISHIAREAGVSVGSVYRDFAGKQELLCFILQCALEPDYMDREFQRPITAELFSGLDSRLIRALEETADTFAGNLSRAGWGYSYENLLSDTFDLLARYGVGCLFIEKNPLVFPTLTAYYRHYRENFFTVMAEYLRKLQACGQLRALEDPELTAVLILEQLSWWAMDVRWTAFETRDIPPERGKAVCLDNLLTAYGRG